MSNKSKAKRPSTSKAKNTNRVVIPVIQMTPRERHIKKFTSMHAASNHTGVNSVSISQVVRGIRKTAGGFRWATAQFGPFDC